MVLLIECNFGGEYMHIAIEGMDGVGKTSAAKLLAEKLNFQFFPKSFHAMADKTGSYDNFIKFEEYIDDKDACRINDCSYGLRGNFLYCKLESQHVVSDRYYVSNFWANAHGQNYPQFQTMIDLLGVPDFTFLLFAEQETARQRMIARNPNDKDLCKIELMPKAYSVMKEFIGRSGLKNMVIDTTKLNLEQVVDLMIKIIKEDDAFDIEEYKDVCQKIIAQGECKVLDSGNGKFYIIDNELRKYLGEEKNVIIPKGVTSICNYAFSSCENLISIKIPDSVLFIGDYAFADCYKLSSISVNKSNPKYKSVDGNLYSKDGKLIQQYAFGKMEQEFTILESVECIGAVAFAHCKNLKSILLTSSVRKIGFASFFGCTNLLQINIPRSVVSIGNNALLLCSSLEQINVDANNEFYMNVYGGLLTKDGMIYKRYAVGSNAKQIELLDGVQQIGVWAFSDSKILEQIVLPNTVKRIGAYAFYNSSINSINIPASVEEIGERAFFNCRNISKVFIESDMPPILGNEAFFKANKSLTVYIPRGSLNAFKTAKNWNKLNFQLKELDFKVCI